MLPPLIGIVGRTLDPDGKPVGSAGAGKDSFYRLVLAPRGYRQIALADPVRAAVLACTAYFPDPAPTPLVLLGRVAEGYYDLYGHTKSPQARKALQSAGGDGRRVDPGLWAYIALLETRRVLQAGGRVAITDLRYANELAALRGDAAWLSRFYDDLEALGGSHLPQVREGLTHTWEEGGVLPPPGMSTAITLERHIPNPRPDGHPSETELLDAATDHTIRADTLLELWERGEALAGPLEAYLADAVR